MKLVTWEAGEKNWVFTEFLVQALLDGFYHYTFLSHNLNNAFIVYASLSWVLESFWLQQKPSQGLCCVAAASILDTCKAVYLPSWIFYIKQ